MTTSCWPLRYHLHVIALRANAVVVSVGMPHDSAGQRAGVGETYGGRVGPANLSFRHDLALTT